MSKTRDSFIGTICKCHQGILGVVTHKQRDIWRGVTLEGKPWSSKIPKRVYDNVDDYVNSTIERNADTTRWDSV